MLDFLTKFSIKEEQKQLMPMTGPRAAGACPHFTPEGLCRERGPDTEGLTQNVVQLVEVMLSGEDGPVGEHLG